MIFPRSLKALLLMIAVLAVAAGPLAAAGADAPAAVNAITMHATAKPRTVMSDLLAFYYDGLRIPQRRASTARDDVRRLVMP